jgi:hypothetical protein
MDKDVAWVLAISVWSFGVPFLMTRAMKDPDDVSKFIDEGSRLLFALSIWFATVAILWVTAYCFMHASREAGVTLGSVAVVYAIVSVIRLVVKLIEKKYLTETGEQQ